MGAVPVDLGIVRDKETTLKGAVLAALDRCDVLVTSGGVSMGEADLLKPILEVRLLWFVLLWCGCVLLPCICFLVGACLCRCPSRLSFSFVLFFVLLLVLALELVLVRARVLVLCGTPTHHQ